MKELIESLFKDIPFSKESENIKKQVLENLEKEYQEELSNCNEIKARGKIMSKYNTIESISKLANITEEELKRITNKSTIISETDLNKILRKEKGISYFLSLVITLLFANVSNLIYYRNPFIIITILLLIGLAFLGFKKYFKLKRNNSYNNIKLNSKSLEYLFNEQDRYKKRLTNSIFIIVGVFSYLTFLPINSLFIGSLKFDELFQVIYNNALIYNISIYLLFKNLFINKLIKNFFEPNIENDYHKNNYIIFGITSLYFILVMSLLFIFRNRLTFIINWYYLFLFIFIIGILIYNFIFRKKYVYKNININKKRIVLFSIVFVVAFVYRFMRMDLFILQPYISSIPAVEYKQDDIIYNEETGVYTIKTDKEDFKILQLTDIHLGGSMSSIIKDYKALNAVYVMKMIQIL